MEYTQVFWISALLVGAIFIPGLALTLAVFPDLKKVRWAERLGLSFVLGMMPQLTLYFTAKNLNIPIDNFTSLGSIILFTGLGYLVFKKRTSL